MYYTLSIDHKKPHLFQVAILCWRIVASYPRTSERRQYKGNIAFLPVDIMGKTSHSSSESDWVARTDLKSSYV